MISATVGVSGSFGSRLFPVWKRLRTKPFLTPRRVGFTSEESLDGEGAAVDLATLDPQVDIGSARITRHDGEFCARDLLQQFGQV